MLTRPKKQHARVEGPKLLSEKATAAMLSRLEKTAGGSKAAIADAAEPVLKGVARSWCKEAERDLSTIAEAAILTALEAWKKDLAKVQRQMVRLMLRENTEDRMTAWAEAAAEQIDAEVDEHNLIDTTILEDLKWKRPARKNEGPGAKSTTAYDATDDEFMAWYLTQLGERGIDNTNRLALRLLLVASLDWIRARHNHWRVPTLEATSAFVTKPAKEAGNE
jgi:hypothetical protein